MKDSTCSIPKMWIHISPKKVDRVMERTQGYAEWKYYIIY